MPDAKKVAIATAAGVILLMQFALFSVVLDLASSLMLLGLGVLAGRFSRG